MIQTELSSTYSLMSCPPWMFDPSPSSEAPDRATFVRRGKSSSTLDAAIAADESSRVETITELSALSRRVEHEQGFIRAVKVWTERHPPSPAVLPYVDAALKSTESVVMRLDQAAKQASLSERTLSSILRVFVFDLGRARGMLLESTPNYLEWRALIAACPRETSQLRIPDRFIKRIAAEHDEPSHVPAKIVHELRALNDR